MKTTLACLLALALASTAHAQTSIEFGGGLAVARAQHDGIWYQRAFPNTLRLKSHALEFGTRTELTDHLALDTRVFWLGRNTSDALAVTNDDTYKPDTPTGCGGPCPPLVRYQGRGWTGGASAMLELHTTGAWQWGIAVGPMFYRTSWTMDVPQWFPSEGPNAIGPRQDVHLSATRWAFQRSVVAVRLTHADWYASLTYYRDGYNLGRAGPDNYFPPIWRSHMALMFGYRF